MTIVSHTICNKKIQWFVLLIIAFFNINVTIGQNCEVNFPGISAKTFSGSCGGVVDNLILGDNQYLGINDTFTFDSPLDISINGNLEINAEGSATIIIPAGVTVTVNGNIEFNAVNDGCDSGNPCTITFSVNGILNGKQNFENEISGLEWSGTGAVNIDGNFENTSDACMQCSPTTCPAFPTVGGNCEGSGSGCPDGDFCTNGNIGNPNPIDPSSPSMNTTYYSRDYGIGPPYSNDWDDANAWTLNPDGSGPAASIPQNNDHVVILPDHEIIINSNVDNGGPARSPNEIGSTKGSNNIGNNGPPNDNPAGFNDDVFYHEGSITVFEGGILTATVGMMIWNSNYISGTLSTSGDLINLGDLFFTETATFSTGDDLIISGNSFTRIDIPDVGNSSSNDDIYIDHTDAFICGLGVLGISNQFQLSNNATLDQVCSIFNITGCSPNPPGTCLSGNGSWPLESPILSGSGGAITFVENSVVAIAPTINVTYSDPFLSEATFIITSGLASLEDELLLPPTTGFSSSYNSSLGELKISGFGSFSEWESVMQSVTYKNLSENPTVTNRTVEFEISDGFNGSNQISIDIAVTAVNDPPVISTTAPATATEDVLYTYVAGVTDPDDANNGTDITWTLSNAPAGMTVSATGVVSWTPPEGITTSGTVTLGVEDGDEDASPPDTEDFVVEVTEVNEPPVISNCPSDIVVSTSGPGCNEIVNWPLPTASDNCSVDTFVSTHDPGDTFPVGATTVTYTATDSDGNSATCSFQVTVNDTSPPLFANCPEDIITYGVGAVTWISPSATDDCSDVNLSSNFNPGDVFPIGTTQVVYTAEDGSGNISTCSFFVTVANDEENPVITNCPPDVVISTTDSTCDNLVTWIPPTASDNDVLSAFTSTHEPGDIFPLGATTVTYTATDDNGNQSTCSFNVIVEDSYPPDFDFCPSSVSVSGFNIDAQLVEVNWEAPIASDNCTSLDLQSNYKPGDLFDPQSTTEVVYTATDGSGNVSECVFEVGPFENNAPSVQNQSIITSHSTPVKIIIDASDPDGDNLSLAEIVFNNAIAEVSEVDSMGISFIYKSLDSNLERDELSVVVKDDGIPFSSAIGTVQIQFLVEIKIEASQIFSPDGNNINDDFYIQNIEEYPENTVQIYDRWGGLIFEANGYDNQSVVWDGTGNNGRIVPNGTYYFLINPGDGVDKLTGAVEVVK
jgi:gliding motility-associated-like protein